MGVRGEGLVCAEASSKSELAGKLAGVPTGACACTHVSRRRVRERAEGVCGAQVGTNGRSRWDRGNENRKEKIRNQK